MKDWTLKLDEVSRRAFAARLAAGLLGVGVLPRWLAGEKDEAPVPGEGGSPSGASGTGAGAGGTARHVIYLYMSGGMSQLDTFDPKPGADTQGPVQTIGTSAPGVRISEYLPRLARQMHRAALVRSLNTTQGAHDRGEYLLQTSYLQRGTVTHPALGSWVLRLAGGLDSSLPGYVRIGGGSRHPGAGFMDARMAPMPIGRPGDGLANSGFAEGVDAERFSRRLNMVDFVDQPFRSAFRGKTDVRNQVDAYREAIRLMSSRELEAFDIDREPETVRAGYGETPFGQGCLLARRLVSHGVRFVEVTMGGWDTHQDNFDRMTDLAGTLDAGLSALIADLASRGMLRQTLVVVATEFGRTPTINGNAGRDHFPKAFSGLLAGGGVRGGMVYGATDARGLEIADGGVTVPDWNATIAHALRLPHDQPLKAPSGRPFKIANDGEPVRALFG